MRILRKSAIAALVAAMTATVSPDAQAKLLLDENFDYPQAGLYNQGGWLRHMTNTNTPIQLTGEGLTYPGYQEQAKGKCAHLVANTDGQQERLKKQFIENPGVTEGSIYLSALVNFKAAPTGNVYFLTLTSRNAKADNGIVDGKGGSEIGRFYATKGSADGKVGLGMSKNSTTVVPVAELDLNKTYLIVLKYEIVEGTANDVVKVWLNPAADAEPATADAVGNSKNADYSFTANPPMGPQAVELRQGSTGSATAPDVLVDAIRVGTAWADLFGEGGGGGDDPEPPAGDGVITASPAQVAFEYPIQYSTYTAVVTVSGKDLEGDITVSSSDASVKPSATTISAADAMADGGFALTLSYTAGASNLNATVTLKAKGAADVVIPVTATDVTPVANTASFAQLAQAEDFQLFWYTGRAKITHIDTQNQVIYAQDISGYGAALSYMNFMDPAHMTFAVGDALTKFYVQTSDENNDYMFDLIVPTVYSQGNTVTPVELTFKELAENLDMYHNRLVTISDVDFGDLAGELFGTANRKASDASGNGFVRAFTGADVAGATIPAKATSVTGISLFTTTATVAMRSSADLVAEDTPVQEASIEVERELLIDATEYQEVGKTVDFGKLTVTYKNLPSPAQIYIGGANRAMFSIDKDVIPAGSGTLEILVKYAPTAPGKHTASIVIDAVPTEASQTISLSARAYDPANLPELSVNTEGLVPFTAAVGQSQEQTVSYTSKNLLDYGTAAVAGTSNGAFKINSATLMKNGTYTVKITFRPLAAGSYTDQITFSADKAEPVTITVTGTATGDAPVEDREGDALTDAVFDTTGAKALYIQDFSEAGVNNKPLSLPLWHNIALTGTRAWWAYKDGDNMVAKVTAYDSKTTDSQLAQMLLVSPALDFDNAAQPLLAFRVKGTLLTDDMFDNLHVIYIDPTSGEETDLSKNVFAAVRAEAEPEQSPLDKVYMQDLGIPVPATADQAGNWYDFIIDLKGQPLASKFFIAFGFTSQRGKDTTVSYFVDDFSWGRSDLKFIRPGQQVVELRTNANGTVTADVDIEGLNLESEIALFLSGEHAKHFAISHATLPAAGGKVSVTFSPAEEGTYNAYLNLSADGAPQSAIILNGVSSKPEGVDNIAAGAQDGPVEVYSLQGVLLRQADTRAEALQGLTPGLYIVNGSKVVVK